MADEDTTKVSGIHFLGFYLNNLGANLFALLTILTLNIFTPIQAIEEQVALILLSGKEPEFFLFFPFMMLLIGLLQYRVQQPILQAVRQLKAENNVNARMLRQAQIRLLNLPFLIALINLLTYVSFPALLVFSLYFFKGFSASICFFLYLRAFMIGLIASSISFFLIENYARKGLIPLFFPEGRLAAVPKTEKISVLRRIRLLTGVGTVNPMLLLLLTLFFLRLEVGETGISAKELADDIFLFSLVLCTIFIGVAFRFNFLVTNSILKPVDRMLQVLENVRHGDFRQMIRVVSNDEIGVLGDSGNAMIRGLAEREQIREAFGKYVTPEIRDQILAGKIPLNGERREATLLFSDLRDFTTFIETSPPEEAFKSMRAYFTAMQKAIRRHHGLVLQYVGDEIEAVFGVPLAFEGHADKALEAALDMRQHLEELNAQRANEGKSPFRHGIGIYTGMVLAGNTGSEDRLSYTLMGDTVNLASRIQDLTKKLNWDILVSRETLKKLQKTYPLEKAPPQTVKGYSKPITVYRMLGL